MKIAVYETVHLDWIIPYAELLAEEDISVSFITLATFKNNLENILAQKNPRYDWHFLNPGDSIVTFYKKVYSVLKSNHCDLVILNSIDSKHLVIFMILLLSRPGKILINLHDINNFFKIKPSLSVRRNIRAAGKIALRLLANGYIVNSESMKEYIMKSHLTQKPVHWLQPVYYKPLLHCKKITVANAIVIPGTIDNRRRDYFLALEVIQEMLNRQVPAKWILAGSPFGNYGIEIINKAKELNSHGANILFYEEEIPENEFQQIIAECSLIFSPLVSITIIHDNITEVYGESKGSGNVYDAIRHAKPFIIPSAVAVPGEIATSCIRYTSKDNLAEQLLKILTQESVFAHYSLKAQENAENFPKERIKNMFTAAFAEVTS